MTVVLLSCNKGKKVWPRVLRLLDSSSTLTLVSHLFTHFHQVDVIKNASIPALYASPSLFPGADASKPTFSQLLQFIESTETFMLYVLPTLVDTLANASWPVIYQCWQWLFDQTDVIGLGSSRVGLSVITLLVSRSEMLFNQVVADQGPHPPPLALPPQAWQQQVFPLLFETLQSHFLTLFPIHHFISLSKKSPDLESYLTDDTHVWQFLTSLVLAANVDQQQALVVEIKERILGNIAAGRGSNVDEKGKRKFNNVSFFLNALGLEANDLL
ncbi:hypothetical protein HMI54_013637 [Coelomomyces lativittatus]|nr:hypothetical protein HMI54_013637 [Coelomomyces lativittatus]KAJ1501736.1 hypothetical protein HMI55_003245 [Coelomomyces lativittatus]